MGSCIRGAGGRRGFLARRTSAARPSGQTVAAAVRELLPEGVPPEMPPREGFPVRSRSSNSLGSGTANQRATVPVEDAAVNVGRRQEVVVLEPSVERKLSTGCKTAVCRLSSGCKMTPSLSIFAKMTSFSKPSFST